MSQTLLDSEQGELQHPDASHLDRLRLQPFGFNTIVPAMDAAGVWSLDPPPDGIPFHIRYDENTLMHCSIENRKGLADWRLVWLYSLSIWDQVRIGARHGKVWFDGDWRRHKNMSTAPWAQQKIEPGNYLVNFKPVYGGKKLGVQEEQLLKLGPGISRAPEAMITQALILIDAITGARPLHGVVCEGPSSHADFSRVHITQTDRGVRIEPVSGWERHAKKNAGVCLMRKFDI